MTKSIIMVKVKDLFVVHLLCDIIWLPLWIVQKSIKRNPNIWIFGAWIGKGFLDNSKRVYEVILAEHPEINAVWITKSKKIRNELKSKGMPVAMYNSPRGIWISLRAQYAILSVNLLDFNEHCLNGIKQIWVWHGMPMKKIGYDLKALELTKPTLKDKIRSVFPYRKNIKPYYFLSTSRFFDGILQSAFHIDEAKILHYGLPRNDYFFSTTEESIISDIKKRFGNPTILLYMPTFRDYSLDHDKKSFDSFDKFHIDVERFYKILRDNNMVFLFKGHFYDLQVNDFDKDLSERFVKLDDSMYDNLYSVIKDVDILLTDYSSIYFDFLLLDKPVILTPFDYEEYIKISRPLYFDYYSIVDGKKAYSWNDVFDVLESKSYYVPQRPTIEKFHDYIDGNSTHRLIDKLLDDK